MLFVARIGDDVSLRKHRELVKGYAAAVGRPVRECVEQTTPGHSFTCAWLPSEFDRHEPSFEASEDQIRFATMPVPDARPGSVPGAQRNLIRGTVDRRNGSASASVPHTTPEPLFWLRGDGGVVLTNDFRMAVRLEGRSIDPAGARALLFLGAIPAPLTLIRGVNRVPCGHELRIGPDGATALVLVPADLPDAEPGDRAHEDRIAGTLDASLAEAPEGSLLYFSGGVDSALLATRLRALGRTDVGLFHFSFRPDDPETAIASRIAGHLGLPMTSVRYEPALVPSMLESIGADYTFPFADFSSIPTNLLVKASLEGRPDVAAVIEGTGADGAFGLGSKARLWQRVLGVPSPIRRILARALARSEFRPWLSGARVDRVRRIAVRSVDLPPAIAAVGSQNVLAGVAYDLPDDVRRRLVGALEEHVETFVRDRSLADRISWIDLVHVCAAQFAPKSFDVLRLRGIQPIYPFLEPLSVRNAFSMDWATKCRGGVEKSILKQMLAREIPGDLVYRSKVGFQPPFQSMLRLPALEPFIERALDPSSNPLLEFSRLDTTRAIFDCARTGERPLTFGALCLLWVHLFLSAWLDQIP